MWAGYEEALTCYGIEICRQWCSTGRSDTCDARLREDLARATGSTTVGTQESLTATGELPPWLGDPGFHRSHRSALLRKDTEHYRHWFTDVPSDLPYVWPVSDRPRRTPEGRATTDDRTDTDR